MTRRCLVLFCGVLVTCLLGCSSTAGDLYPGKSLPDIKLEDLDGNPVSLSKFTGKNFLLNFWATWCAPCVSEMPALENLVSKLGKENFTVIAVALDDEVAELQQFRAQHNLTFPILVDRTGVSRKMFKLNGVPESFFIDASGKFKLFFDPTDQEPMVRIIGPREWSSPAYVAAVQALFKLSTDKTSNPSVP